MLYPGWLRALRRGALTTPFPFRTDPDLVEAEGALLLPGPGLSPGHGPLARSVAIRHVDAGSCNGCESEISLLSSAVYDLSRFGFSFTPSPRHADILLVTGVITQAMVPMLKETYLAMPAPKRVVAVGGCAMGGEVFAGAPGVIGDLSRVLPVDVRVPGCPPSPARILAALLEAAGRPVKGTPVLDGPAAGEGARPS